jgi:hypothetical protein
MQRRLARRVLPSLHLLAMEPLICRSHSSSVPSHEIIGAYTPVTKRLWVERLNWASKLKEATLAPCTVPKPPNPITVTYPFSTDNALAEMVGCLLPFGRRPGRRHQQRPCQPTPLGPCCCPPSPTPTPMPRPAQYRNPWGSIRMGRLLEDLDSLAGNCAFDHWWGAARQEPARRGGLRRPAASVCYAAAQQAQASQARRQLKHRAPPSQLP